MEGACVNDVNDHHGNTALDQTSRMTIMEHLHIIFILLPSLSVYLYTYKTVSIEETIHQKEASTTPFTTGPGCQMVEVHLNQTCGMGTTVYGHCTTPGSACDSVDGSSERKCSCAFGTIEVGQDCQTPPSKLFEDLSPVSLPSNMAPSSIVLNVTLNTLSGAIKEMQIFPADSFLHLDSSDTDISKLYLVKSLPVANVSHTFTLLSKVTYPLTNVTISDVTQFTIYVTPVSESEPPVQSVLVVDGTRAGSIIADLNSAVGSVEGLNLELKTDRDHHPFQLSNNLVVCSRDVMLSDFTTDISYVGISVTLNVTTSDAQVILVLRIAVIVNSLENSVIENEDLSAKIVDYSPLVDYFDVTVVLSNEAADYLMQNMTGYFVQFRNHPDYRSMQEPTFRLIVSVTAKENSAVTTTIHVSVPVLKDPGDPDFKQANYRFSVLQGADVGTIVGLLDLDEADRCRDDISLVVQGGFGTYFETIEPHNGALVLAKSLPPLNPNSTHDFTVTVMDSKGGANSATVVIEPYKFNPVVKQVGENKNETIEEELPSGEFVTNVSVTNYTDYELKVPSKYFQINATTGEITTKIVIDRETLTEKNPILIAAIAYPEDNKCHADSVGNVGIMITDINDNPPEFGHTLYNSTISEHSQVGTSVFQVTATDKDIGVNAELRYSLQGAAAQSFSIDNSGLITVKNSSQLDRESSDTLQLSVTVRDGGDSAGTWLSDSATVTVTLSDINDNAPVFQPMPHSFNVSEGSLAGNVITTVSATDQDIGDNGRISYQLLRGDKGMFTLDPDTGVLNTTHSLDREQTSSFTLTVMAMDEGSPRKSSSITLYVNVTDINDEDPKFPNFNYLPDSKLPENTPCTSPIITVSATDNDEGSNAEIVYSMNSDLLRVDPITGDVFCKNSLDYENETHREITELVFATDGGTPALNNSARVHVSLEDVNDNGPKFDSTTYNFSLVKLPGGDFNPFVGVVFATDSDSGVNGEITYHLPTGPTHPVVVNEEGVIEVNSAWQSSGSATNYTGILTATDKGSPPQTATATLSIVIPTKEIAVKLFSNITYEAEMVEERVYNSQPIVKLDTVDAAANIVLTLENVPHPCFSVDQDTGEVFCGQPIDRDAGDDPSKPFSFKLFVKATSGSDVQFTFVTINVRDVNDNPPKFTKEESGLKFDIEENLPVGIFVERVTVTATDRDYGNNGSVNYSILDNESPFTLDSTNGTLRISGDVDRETKDIYTLVVMATDNGSPPKNASIRVTITVSDLNDNKPEFLPGTPHQLSISEDASSADTILNLGATDADLGFRGKVTFSILNRNDCPLDVESVGSKNGTLRLKPDQKLDYENESQRTFLCMIQAQDHGEPHQLSSSHNITFVVEDVNDNPPVLNVTGIPDSVSRDTKPGVVIGKVTAHDDDSPAVTSLHYAVKTVVPDINSTQTEYFTISDVTDGVITASRALRFVPVEVMTLNVTVRDFRGGNFHTVYTLVNISISDNNTSPDFQTEVFTFSVKEEETGTNFTVSAVDYDGLSKTECNCSFSLENIADNDFHCNITDFTQYFTIDAETGVVENVKEIDRESAGDCVKGRVVVTDRGVPPKSDTAELVVTVVDKDDNYPEFPADSVTISLTKSNCNANALIYTLNATDRDEEPNEVVFSVLPDYDNYIAVNGATGELTLKMSVCDITDDPVFKATVVARDDASRSDYMTIVVTLIGDNPHAPVFVQPEYQREVPFTAEKGNTFKVVNFFATDADNDNITYSITDGNHRETFEIDPKTGILTLQYVFDNDTPRLFNLTITATDHGNFAPRFSKSATTMVLLTISKQTPQTCLSESEASTLQSQADQFHIYRGLLFGIAALLALALILLVFLCYKWRVTKAGSEENGRDTTGDSSSQMHSLFQPTLGQSSEGKSGDTSGLPPKPPKRSGDHSGDWPEGRTRGRSNEQSGDSGLVSGGSYDSDGYLAPSTSAGPSDQTFGFSDDSLRPLHAVRSATKGNDYLAMMPPMVPEGYSSLIGRPKDAAAKDPPRGYLNVGYVDDRRPLKTDSYVELPDRVPEPNDTYLHGASAGYSQFVKSPQESRTTHQGRGSSPDDSLPPPAPHSSHFNLSAHAAEMFQKANVDPATLHNRHPTTRNEYAANWD